MGASRLGTRLAAPEGHRAWRGGLREVRRLGATGAAATMLLCLLFSPAIAQAQDPGSGTATPPAASNPAPDPVSPAPDPAPSSTSTAPKTKSTTPAAAPRPSNPAPASTVSPSTPAASAPVSSTPVTTTRAATPSRPVTHRSSRAVSHKRAAKAKHHAAKAKRHATRHHAAPKPAKTTAVAKPTTPAVALRALSRKPPDSSPVDARDIGVAGLSLLLLALAGGGLLVTAARFERGRLGG